jgi:hypothetical protein
VDELHRRAGLWLEENGFALEAAGHAIAARDHERAASLLEEAGRRTCCPTRAGVWLGYFRALPRASRCAFGRASPRHGPGRAGQSSRGQPSRPRGLWMDRGTEAEASALSG